MRSMLLSLVAAAALSLSAVSAEALPPVGVASGGDQALAVIQVAEGCGPGLVRGRRGTCLRRPAVFSRGGRILRPGCGKPIGAGLRTPC